MEEENDARSDISLDEFEESIEENINDSEEPFDWNILSF